MLNTDQSQPATPPSHLSLGDLPPLPAGMEPAPVMMMPPPVIPSTRKRYHHNCSFVAPSIRQPTKKELGRWRRSIEQLHREGDIEHGEFLALRAIAEYQSCGMLQVDRASIAKNAGCGLDTVDRTLRIASEDLPLMRVYPVCNRGPRGRIYQLANWYELLPPPEPDEQGESPLVSKKLKRREDKNKQGANKRLVAEMVENVTANATMLADVKDQKARVDARGISEGIENWREQREMGVARTQQLEAMETLAAHRREVEFNAVRVGMELEFKRRLSEFSAKHQQEVRALKARIGELETKETRALTQSTRTPAATPDVAPIEVPLPPVAFPEAPAAARTYGIVAVDGMEDAMIQRLRARGLLR